MIRGLNGKDRMDSVVFKKGIKSREIKILNEKGQQQLLGEP